MNKTTTLNGAETYVSTTSPLLDWFSLGGATRKNQALTEDLFRKALAENASKAIRILFYLRDVRGGQGERDVFRTGMRILADEYVGLFEAVAPLIADYGRYDDLVRLIDTKSSKAVIKVIKNQLAEDGQSETPSLLAKWLPSENTSSKETRKLAKLVRMGLGITEREYRIMLTELRKLIKIVEHNLSTKDYDGIDYSKLPSQAGMKYKKAFKKHDEKRYAEYIESVAKGEKKINTATLYPYQIYKSVQAGDDVKVLDVMWNNLPDYTQGKNALVVADVSGSMSGDPLSVSVSLALYFADKNKGQFKDHFITFSANPVFQQIQGKNIREKMDSIERSQWDMNTDLNKVFAELIRIATTYNTPKDEMPSTIYIISDMEFDSCAGGTNFEAIKKMFASTKYEMPSIVFWNVNATHKQVPVTKDERGVTMVSGFSASTFSLVVDGKSPIELMEEVINSERYCKILG